MKKLSTSYYTDAGGRRANEDSLTLFTDEDSVFAGLADGLGGEGNGGTAARLAMEVLGKYCRQNKNLSGIEMKEAFLKANQEILFRQSEVKMKTTAVLLQVRDNMVLWGHIGDSRLYHFDRTGRTEVTLDHSLSQMSVFLGDIRREDIAHDKNRNVLLKALGCDDAEPDICQSHQLGSGKHGFLLCSDGFWECFRDEELSDAFMKSENAEDWLISLRKQLVSRLSAQPDNNSAITIVMEV